MVFCLHNLYPYLHIYLYTRTFKASNHIWERTCGICLFDPFIYFPGWSVSQQISCFFMAEQNPVVYLYHIFINHLYVDGHLGWFHVLPKCACRYLGVRMWSPLGKCLEVLQLSLMAIFRGSSILTSIIVTLICSSHLWIRFRAFPISSNPCYVLSLNADVSCSLCTD